MKKTKTLETKLVRRFNGFQIWQRGDKRALYDIKAKKVLMTYTKNEDISKYINYWARIKNTNSRR